MEVRDVYLLVTMFHRDKNIYFPPNVDNDCRIGVARKGFGDFLFPYDVVPVLKPKINSDYWEKNVNKIAIYKCVNLFDRCFATVLYQLNPECLTEILSTTYYSAENNPLRTLIAETFPDVSSLSEAIRQKRKNGRYEVKEELCNYKLLEKEVFYSNSDIGFIDPYLIINPSRKELELDLNRENISDLVFRFEKLLNRDITVNINTPYHYYFDFIETTPIGYTFSNGIDLRVFLYTRLVDEECIVISQYIYEFLQFDIRLKTLYIIERQMQTLYSNMSNIERYVERLFKKDIYRNYSMQYKKERLKYIQAKFQIESILDEFNTYEDDIPRNLQEYHDFEMQSITQNYHRIPYSILRSKNSAFDRLVKSIKYSLEMTKSKDLYINEYLRDRINIESIQTNLKLQKTIGRLTIGAFFLAIIAIVITLYTPEIKLWINEKITQLHTLTR